MWVPPFGYLAMGDRVELDVRWRLRRSGKLGPSGICPWGQITQPDFGNRFQVQEVGPQRLPVGLLHANACFRRYFTLRKKIRHWFCMRGNALSQRNAMPKFFRVAEDFRNLPPHGRFPNLPSHGRFPNLPPHGRFRKSSATRMIFGEMSG